MYTALFCPFCKSSNIEPRGKTYHCNNCGEDFEHAITQLPQPKEPKKKKKGE